MAELTNSHIEAASALGNVLRAAEPRATSVRFDSDLQEIVVSLTNGGTFMFPPRLVQGLESASPQELADVELLGEGYGLHWDMLDVDYTVPGLLAGIFGTKSYMAKLAGQTRSPAKALAARKNGLKGGRPRKTAHG
jgi:Protein of unknown function (DUF2442)